MLETSRLDEWERASQLSYLGSAGWRAALLDWCLRRCTGSELYLARMSGSVVGRAPLFSHWGDTFLGHNSSQPKRAELQRFLKDAELRKEARTTWRVVVAVVNPPCWERNWKIKKRRRNQVSQQCHIRVMNWTCPAQFGFSKPSVLVMSSEIRTQDFFISLIKHQTC